MFPSAIISADLVQWAPTGVFQVAQVKLKNLLLQLTELDPRLLKEVLLHFRHLVCQDKTQTAAQPSDSSSVLLCKKKMSQPKSGESWFCDLSFLHSDTTSRMALKWKSIRLSMAGSVTCPPSWKRSHLSPNLCILMPICHKKGGELELRNLKCSLLGFPDSRHYLFTHEGNGVVHTAVDNLSSSPDGDAQRGVIPDAAANPIPRLQHHHLESTSNTF